MLASNEAFAILWANPPYDHDKTAKNNKRVEFAYLRHAWKWAQDGAYAIWVVYAQHMTERAASVGSMSLRSCLRMSGISIIHPKQIEDANAAFTPDKEDIDYAQAVVNAFEDGVLERFAETLRTSRSTARRAKVLAKVAAKIETEAAA